MIIKGTRNVNWNLSQNILPNYNDLVNINNIYTDTINTNNVNWISKFEIEVIYDSTKAYQSLQIQDIHPDLPTFTYWDLKEVKYLANKKLVCSYYYNFWNAHGIDIINNMIATRPDVSYLRISSIYSYDYVNMVRNNLSYVEGSVYELNEIKLSNTTNNKTSYYYIDSPITINYNSTTQKYYISNDFTTNLTWNWNNAGLTTDNFLIGTKWYLIKNPFYSQTNKDFFTPKSPILAIPALYTKNDIDDNDYYFNNDNFLFGLLSDFTISWNDSNRPVMNQNYADSKLIGIVEWLPAWLVNDKITLHRMTVTVNGFNKTCNGHMLCLEVGFNNQTYNYKTNIVTRGLQKENNNFFSYNLSPKAINYTQSTINLNYISKYDYTNVLSANIYSDNYLIDNFVISSTETLPYYTDDYYAFVNATKNSANTSYKNAQKQAGLSIGMGIVSILSSILLMASGVFTGGATFAAGVTGMVGAIGGLGAAISGGVSLNNQTEQIKSNYTDKQNSSGLTNNSVTKTLNSNYSDLYRVWWVNNLNNINVDQQKIYLPLIGYNYSNDDNFNDDYEILISNSQYLSAFFNDEQLDYPKVSKKWNFKLLKNSTNLVLLNKIIRNNNSYYNEKDISEILDKLSDNLIKIRDFNF